MRIDRKFKALASFALVVLLGGLGSLGVAHAQSGSAGVQSGKGFGCMPGFEWKMFPDGVARCTSTAAPRAITATSCAAAPSYTTDKTGSCTFSLPATGGGATASVRNTNTDSFTGALTIECSAGGQWTNPIGSCVEVPRITSFNRSASSVLIGDGMTVSWTSSGATAANLVCSGANNSSAANLGANSNRGLSTANEGSTTCTLTVTGPGGTSAPASLTWSARGPLDCSATSISPGVCRYPIPALASGQSQVASTNTAGYAGAVTATCNDGTWSYSGATCTSQTNPCSATSTAYGSCSFSVPALTHGESRAVAGSTAGYTGQVTATCSNGSVSFSARSCTADVVVPSDCSAASTTYGSCSFSVPALAHGASRAVADSTAGYTGSVTASCNNGTLSYSGRTCAQDVAAPVGCSATSTTYGSCSFSVPAIAHGGSAAVNDSTAGYTGQVTASCNNGTLSYSGRTCTQDVAAPVGCSATSTSYGSCSFSVPAIAHGNSAAVNDSTAGYTGQVTASCNNGTVSYSGQSCAADLKIPVASVSVSRATVGEDDTITASWSGTNSPDYYWAWGQNQGKATSWTGTPRQLGITPGDYMLYAFACNAAGCSDAATQLITVTPPPPPANCSATTTTYGSCGFSVPAIAHGNSAAVNDSTAGYTGQVTASCNNGKVSFSGQSCTADPKVPVASLSLPSQVREDVSFTATWSGTNSPTYYEVMGSNMGLTTSWSGTPMSLGLVPGIHTISLQACNTAGCSDVVSKELKVLARDPDPPVNTNGGTMAGGVTTTHWASWINGQVARFPCIFSESCPYAACAAGLNARRNVSIVEPERRSIGGGHVIVWSWQCGSDSSPTYSHRIIVCGGYFDALSRAYSYCW